MIDYSDTAKQREAEQALHQKVKVELDAYIKSLNLMLVQERQLKTLIDDYLTTGIAVATVT